MVKAHVFKAEEDNGRHPQGASKQIPQDRFEGVQDLIEPPYDPGHMIELMELSSALSSSVHAMEVNIEGFGYRLVPRINLNEVSKATRQAAGEEKRQLTNRLNTLPQGMSLTKLRRKHRRHLEATGNGYYEVLRGRDDKIIGLRLIRSHQMRLTKLDPDFQVMNHLAPEIQEDGSVRWINIREPKRFRRYVQVVTETASDGSGSYTTHTANTRYFKEFGDPRTIDNVTGEVVEDPDNWGVDGEPMPEGRKANEIYHSGGDSLRSPYGIPHFAAAEAAILGAREGEEINFFTIKNGTVPAIAVTVSNGRLTEETLERIEEYVSEAKGSKNHNSFLVLEGEDADASNESDETNQVKISITQLGDSQIKEQLFGDYIANNEKRIRSAFRIPALFMGLVEDLSRTTADVAKRLTDEQVFAPEREESDWFFNNVILANWGIRYWKVVSKTPNVTDNRELISMLAAAERTGGSTPRIARSVVEEVFPEAEQAPPIPDDVNPDQPMSMTMAQLMNNESDASEPNQQGAPVQPSSDPSRATPTNPADRQENNVNADDEPGRNQKEAMQKYIDNFLWDIVDNASKEVDRLFSENFETNPDERGRSE